MNQRQENSLLDTKEEGQCKEESIPLSIQKNSFYILSKYFYSSLLRRKLEIEKKLFYFKKLLQKNKRAYPVCIAKESKNPLLIQPSTFDECWYLSNNSHILELGIMPFEHYVKHGWKEFKNPHWLFDVSFFLQQYPQIQQQGLEPFTYYCEEGWKKGMKPHPAFDVDWYVETTPEALNKDPLTHYLSEGWKKGKSPNPLFSPSWYLERYPDLPKDYNPFNHYLNFGKKEGRLPNPFNSDLYKNNRNISSSIKVETPYIKEKVQPFLKHLNKKKETILLVSHEASLTGAPILVYNLASSLKKKYNVILLTLGKGRLLKDFEAVADILLGPFSEQSQNSEFFYLLFKQISKRVKIKYSLVNSIVSSSIILPLFRNNIPIIHLIHEFSSYTRPINIFLNSAFFSDKQIYSADIVHKNAIKDIPQLNSVPSIILPQGICNVPVTNQDLYDSFEEVQKIKHALRPPGWPEDTVVILGAGTVSLRKGVDLFIACAKRVLELGPKKKFRFVWIGDGFDPELDGIYSVYLTDQIARSDLTDIISIVKPIKEINNVYLHSDIMFLSSRLDPLPLVALDALHHKKPLVCFDSATGIAEYLVKNEDTSFNVIPYLNIEVAAQRIYQLIESDVLRAKIGAAGEKIASSVFNFSKYTDNIDKIAQQCVKERNQEVEDEKIIRKSNVLKENYMIAPHAHLPCTDIIKWYIKNQKAHFQLRKPFPGFHPEIYAEHHQLEGRDPLAHYIMQGYPKGAWTKKVIKKMKLKPVRPLSLPIALHIHLYYTEMAAEILHRLREIKYPLDLLISVTSAHAAAIATKIFSKYTNGTVVIKQFPNYGRNFGSLLTGFKETILKNYKIIGHIHTKKSPDMGDLGMFDALIWTHFLYSNLLGGSHGMANTIFEEFQNSPELGLVFPDDPNIVAWGKNQSFAKELVQKMGIKLPLEQSIDFPIGSMFWARTEALHPLFNLNLNWADYPKEPLPHDGSMLHAIERLLPLIVQHSGYTSATTYVESITR